MEFFSTRQNVEMPKIIYGTAWKKEKNKELVYKALINGFKGIDTACQPKHYNESGVGEGIKKYLSEGNKRNDLFIQTKFTPFRGQDPNNCPYDPKLNLSDQVKKSFETSKKNLFTDQIDSLVLHSPLNTIKDTLIAWKVFESFVKAGEVKQLGISNCYELEFLKQLFENSDIKPSVVQNRFYADTDYDKDLREWCNQNNIIYQSFWSLTANPNILANKILKNLAIKYNQSPAQIFYRYLTQINICPLNGTTSDSHMKEDLKIFDFKLEKIEIQNITELF